MVTYSTIGVLGAGEVGRAVTGQAVRHYDDAGLLRRHGYAAEVLGRPPAAHFCEKHVTELGLVCPTHRHVVPIDANGEVLPEPVLITIDLAAISVA